MKTTYSLESSVGFQRTTPLYISGDRNLHNHRCGNLKSYILSFLLLYWRYNPVWVLASFIGSCPVPFLQLTFCFNLILIILKNTNCRNVAKLKLL
jgi:hypothetical protein